jgi:hypothetical protein
VSRPRPSISQLIERFPDDRQSLVASAERIKRYAQECGCTAGAVAFTLSAALALAYYIWPQWPAAAGRPVSRVWAVPFVLIAAGIAKAGALLIARLRLEHAYRQLYRKYGLR